MNSAVTSAIPLGATVTPAGVTYRTWAPDHGRVEAAIQARDSSRRLLPLEAEGGGFFSGTDPAGRAGDTYRYVPDGREPVPDVASRFQPEGVFGPSAVVDPLAYAWKHPGWRRPPFHGRVLYELHVGAFTPAGTFRAAIGKLDHLDALGVDTLEIMPVADFPGRWNWGYDGVMLFAPARCYGTPDDFRALVDAAHGRGLAVVLDVVYNHPGPGGNHFARYAAGYFNAAGDTPWGASWNLDGERSGPVREFFRQNAACWLDEFRLDGLRLDATHAIADRSPRHLCAEIADLAHARGAFVIAEDERNASSVVAAQAPSDWGFDAVWADDFHHSLRVALTGQRESYFGSFAGTPEECADILNHGWKYRGQYFPHWRRPRGAPSRQIPPEKFVICLANHDQVGNRPLGDRLSQGISAEAARAAAMLLCLCPYTPMFFMGQEWSASTPFLFFTDHEPELGRKIDAGRRREFAAAYAANGGAPGEFPPPQAEATFLASKLQWREGADRAHQPILALHTACLQLRRAEKIFRNPRRPSWSARALGGGVALRWTGENGAGDWLLLVGLGREASWAAGPALPPPGAGLPEFLAPGPGRAWRSVIFSHEPRFGGSIPVPAALLPDAAFPAATGWLLHEFPAEAPPWP